MKKPVIAITMGDPGGIGPEVTLKALKKIRVRSAEFMIIGSPETWKETRERPEVPFVPVPCFKIEKQKISKWNAQAAFAAIRKAADLALTGRVQAIVTAPVNKTAMRLVDSEFVGHTEYFAKRAKVQSFAMMFVSKKLKVTLATIHVPVSRLSRLIRTPLVFEKIRLTDEFLKKYFRIRRPKIAVCALNPHGKETGPEDEKYIRPAVEKACKKGMVAVGPRSADQLFFDAYEGRFDAVVSMYHDQGLAPFKMIAFRDGVNVTLGLPFIRTSPDHGTAFEIAYKNKADERSMIAAIELAIKLSKGKR
ncbi:MAG: 4-hydroxythreonine-4-phosphate dehydrogenase PdxA [Candidatus Omnitrophica bacterium]|nr:4-hydroxythreonine-4-phosphate dehydrogenase PdxA [Candidatus Omnitrophota bacterium]